MVLMIVNGMRGGICHAIHQYAKAYNKYMKNHDVNKEFLFLKYWDMNNLYVWEISQKFPVNGFMWVENTCQFNEDFIKNYNEDRDEGYFLEFDVLYSKKLHGLYNDLPFLLERLKIQKVKKLLVTYMIKKNKSYT